MFFQDVPARSSGTGDADEFVNIHTRFIRSQDRENEFSSRTEVAQGSAPSSPGNTGFKREKRTHRTGKEEASYGMKKKGRPRRKGEMIVVKRSAAADDDDGDRLAFPNKSTARARYSTRYRWRTRTPREHPAGALSDSVRYDSISSMSGIFVFFFRFRVSFFFMNFILSLLWAA